MCSRSPKHQVEGWWSRASRGTIVFALEVRAEADRSSHLFAVPLRGIFTTKKRPISMVNGKSTQ